MLRGKMKLIGLFVAITLLLGGCAYGAYRYTALVREVAVLREASKTPAEVAKEEGELLAKQVAGLISVPADETPTVATVSNKDKLIANPFFAQAQNGDKVLIYQAAKKAILFRPSDNKIIEVAPISIGSASAAIKQNEIRVVLYNGAGVSGLTKRFEPKLTAAMSDVVVVARDNAKKSDYPKSMVIDLTGAQSAKAVELANALGMTVDSLPAGETTPTESADILILLGTDQK